MFTLENIIGDVVFVSLRDKSFLSKIAIPEDLNHFKIKGQDQLGLWVEHPQLTFKYKLDQNGKSIPGNEKKPENVDAVFLIAWGNIDTIMHYPDREGYDFPSEFETDIGFK